VLTVSDSVVGLICDNGGVSMFVIVNVIVLPAVRMTLVIILMIMDVVVALTV
jgi:hypothetical protein